MKTSDTFIVSKQLLNNIIQTVEYYKAEEIYLSIHEITGIRMLEIKIVDPETNLPGLFYSKNIKKY